MRARVRDQAGRRIRHLPAGRESRSSCRSANAAGAQTYDSELNGPVRCANVQSGSRAGDMPGLNYPQKEVDIPPDRVLRLNCHVASSGFVH